MISIVVPAHNESSVLARTLSQWVTNPTNDEIGVVVVCNGCTDDTANVARRFAPTVRVVELETASKTLALNLGDQLSIGFPRIYVDADVVITADAIRLLSRRLDQGDLLAVAPRADIDLTGCSWLVRKYYGIRALLPSSHEGIGGSGVYALSEAGRGRFGQFPDVTADDTYVRLLFRPEERSTLTSVRSTVFPPRSIGQLVRVRSRAYAGTVEIATRFPELRANRAATNNQALIRLFASPRVWAGLLVYCAVNILARFRAVLSTRAGGSSWQRDKTSRVALP
jgi:glycosyltransferase involved in cell wall biosynthesis